MITLITALALLGLALAGVWFDLRERRVPNALTMGGLLVALALRFPDGAGALAAGAVGAALAFALALPFFLLGGLGGGDVKLLSAFGAFLGPGRLGLALLVMALVGGTMAVVAVLRKGAVRETMANLHTILATFGRRSFSGWREGGGQAAVTLETPGVIGVPYAVAIAVGAVCSWFVYSTHPEWSLLTTLSGWLP